MVALHIPSEAPVESSVGGSSLFRRRAWPLFGHEDS
jgi:hypothetical protein